MSQPSRRREPAMPMRLRPSPSAASSVCTVAFHRAAWDRTSSSLAGDQRKASTSSAGRKRASTGGVAGANVESGWHDAGIVDGQNKLVPSVRFTLQNVTAEPIESVQVNAVFRQVTEDLAWGDRLIRGVGSEGLAGGATGNTLIVRSPRGYTGIQSRAEMLKNKDFFFVNTHIPYEGEIGPTDAFIPFDQTTRKLNEYPTDKNAKIVVYCRSGRMSDIAARELVKAGYTNVWNLDGGMIAWERAGYAIVTK